MIQIIPEVLTPGEIRRFRELRGQASWQDGQATAGHLAIHVKANEQLGQNDPLARHLADFQGLTQDNPEQPAVARLTGMYHNLPREWCDA